ncbi:MAG: hypothetical protein K9H25_18945 [Rhodospirillum sp.]|nr:hypothetical protein [Rhodospirillum sp.]MCF8489600.1 hypothetical protein [Rhodospirillum sp.]MCF8499631.1 hypothetical protein [Rhodospirillum sp.]
MTIAIIADDLTGANDSGLQFSSRGLSTTVFLGLPEDSLLTAPAVAVIDTETRAMTAADVTPVVERIARRLRDAHPQHVYKKMDSTLRGHVGLELAATARTLDSDHIFLCPAFPAMKRTVEEGILRVDGTPVSETAIGRDPGSPVRESHIATLIGPDLPDWTPVAVSRNDLASPEAFARRLASGPPGHGRVCAIFDAQTDDDLRRIAHLGARFAEETGKRVLWAGSAGLATSLPEAWGLPLAEATPPSLPPATRPPLLVVGSVNPASIGQCDEARNSLGVPPVVLSPEQLLTDGPERQREIARGIAALGARVAKGDLDLILTTAHAPKDVESIVALAKARCMTRTEAGRRIATGIAQVAHALVRDGQINRLVLTGGDTARAVMEDLGINALTVGGAIEPGIPLITTLGGPRRHIVTKAGGFGAPGALSRAMRFLRDGSLSL